MDPEKSFLKETIKKLPSGLRDFVISDAWSNSLREITGSLLLSDEEWGNIEDETLNVLLGLTHPEDYEFSLSLLPNVSKESARTIAQQVSQRIFGVVKPYLDGINTSGENKIETVAARQEVIEGFDQLPEKLKTAITSVNTEAATQNVARKHNLHIDQAGVLYNEVALVLLGASPTSTLAETLQEQLKISPQEAQGIATDINQQIFLPIRESLKRASEAPVGEELSPNELVAQIEKSTSPWPQAGGRDKATGQGTIVEQKLGGAFSMPKPPAPEKPKQVDPYLEQV